MAENKSSILVRFNTDREKKDFHIACMEAGISMVSLVRAAAGVIIRKRSNDLKGFDQTIAVRLVTLAGDLDGEGAASDKT